MVWGVTVQDVLDATGERVSEAVITMASSDVDIYTNRTEAASGVMQARDLHWIRQAVIRQAAWLPYQPGVAGRISTTRVVQDGVTVETGLTTSGAARPHANDLAPMAARAIKNLSWKGSRSVPMKNTSRRRCGHVWDPTLEANDCCDHWEEL